MLTVARTAVALPLLTRGAGSDSGRQAWKSPAVWAAGAPLLEPLMFTSESSHVRIGRPARIPRPLDELHALPDDALLDTKEAAAFLSVAANSLSWHRCRGGGPNFIHVGSAVRYKLGVLRAYIGGGAQ